MPQYVMAAQISGTRNGLDWPKRGEPTPDLPADELAHLIAIGHVRVVEPAPVGKLPEPEVTRPVAPEVRARARRTRPVAG